MSHLYHLRFGKWDDNSCTRLIHATCVWRMRLRQTVAFLQRLEIFRNATVCRMHQTHVVRIILYHQVVIKQGLVYYLNSCKRRYNNFFLWAGALVYSLREETRIKRLWVRIPVPETGWTFFTFICCKNCNNVCLKRPKNKQKKRPGLAHFLKKDCLENV